MLSVSPPLRHSTPDPCQHSRTSAFRDTCISSRATQDDTHDASRPVLKRQATAPLPLSSTVLTKKRRDGIMTPENDQPLWSDDVHSAFLGALQMHPPIPTCRINELCSDVPDDDQADYCRIIQDYILRKTGHPHSFEQISEKINLVLSSPLASPLVKTPSDFNFGTMASPDTDAHPFSSQKESIPNNPIALLNTPEVDSTVAQASESPSMSRRRKACNRPTLNLHVNMPPATHPFSSGTAQSVPYNCGSASSGLTPLTASFLSFSGSAISEDGLYPCTPLEQCHKGPLVPPEISRAVGINRLKTDRWIPTPTEGVLPSLSCVSAIPSSLSMSSESSSESPSSSDSAGSTATERVGLRPRMSNRAVSWLSLPKRVAPLHVDSSAPDNPIGPATAPGEDASVISTDAV